MAALTPELRPGTALVAMFLILFFLAAGFALATALGFAARLAE
jgi:uncharacterized membrane protein